MKMMKVTSFLIQSVLFLSMIGGIGGEESSSPSSTKDNNNRPPPPHERSGLGLSQQECAADTINTTCLTHVTVSEPHNNGVCFYLAPNGNGTVEGIYACSNDFKEVDDVIEKYCVDLIWSPHIQPSQCERGKGARLVTHSGVRVLKFDDILDGERVYMIPQGLHFQWPSVKVGNVLYARSVAPATEGKLMRLVQLSLSPRVFRIENFVDDKEIVEVLAKNENRMTKSEVGFAGWEDSEGTRTSDTSWDGFSQASKRIQRRSFDLLAMDFSSEQSDTLQVLRYQPGQWYKPHTDYFDDEGYDGNDPTQNNGTNRYATVFLYLSDVEEGGETVFPLSTTHEGYNGEYLVHEGTVDTPGYIDNKDAKWVCNASSKALRSTPRRGNAVLFYSQLPDGSLDPYSLHGGCPPIKGIKWSGNVWIWNRPSPDKSEAKDAHYKTESKKDSKEKDESIKIRFVNDLDEKINLFWDPNFGEDPYDEDVKAESEYVLQGTIEPKKIKPINTYLGHVFYARRESDQVYFWSHSVTKEDDDSRVYIK